MHQQRIIAIEEAEVVALATIYAADRSDQAATANNAIALLGAGVAYATATLAFYDQIVASLSEVLIALLPFPLWMVALYHALLTGVSMNRTASIRVMERQLLRHTALSTEERALVGYSSVEQVLNIFRARWPHKFASVVTYAGTGVVTIGFTVYVLLQDRYLAPAASIAVITGYGLLTALWVWCWISALAEYRSRTLR